VISTGEIFCLLLFSGWDPGVDVEVSVSNSFSVVDKREKTSIDLLGIALRWPMLCMP
jgi:hypothetical protein